MNKQELIEFIEILDRNEVHIENGRENISVYKVC